MRHLTRLTTLALLASSLTGCAGRIYLRLHPRVPAPPIRRF